MWLGHEWWKCILEKHFCDSTIGSTVNCGSCSAKPSLTPSSIPSLKPSSSPSSTLTSYKAFTERTQLEPMVEYYCPDPSRWKEGDSNCDTYG